MYTVFNLLHPSVFSNHLLKEKKALIISSKCPAFFSKKKYEDIRKRYSCSEPISLDNNTLNPK